MSFNNDLAIGELAESWVADALSEAWGHSIIKNPDKESKSNDLIDQDTGATIEVKHDRKIAQTGNVALEYECNGKPSGIKASTATYWVYVIKGDIWIAERQTILRWLMKNHTRCKKVEGGDGKRAKMLLLKFYQFKSIFQKI